MFPKRAGVLKVASSTKYERALIDSKSIITTTKKSIINRAMTLSYCKNLSYVDM